MVNEGCLLALIDRSCLILWPNPVAKEFGILTMPDNLGFNQEIL